ARRTHRGRAHAVLHRTLGQPALAAPLPRLLQPFRHGPPGPRSGVLPLCRRLGRGTHPGAGALRVDRSADARESVSRIDPHRQLLWAGWTLAPPLSGAGDVRGAPREPGPADPLPWADRSG